jgi:hypothetical protein
LKKWPNKLERLSETKQTIFFITDKGSNKLEHLPVTKTISSSLTKDKNKLDRLPVMKKKNFLHH